MKRPDAALVLRARWIHDPHGGWIDGGGVLVARGRVHEVLRSGAQVRAAGGATEDLGDVALLPGFVNAHAHLELSALRGAAPGAAGFVAWVEAVLRRRAGLAPEELARAARAAARGLLSSGTTTVGDIDSMGITAGALRGVPLRVRAYREVLDAGDPARTAQALALLEAPGRGSALRLAGLSPHAPHTVSDELWAALRARFARRRPWVAMHWAESVEEDRWMRRGDGAFATLLRHPRSRSGLESIEDAGLLGPRTALIHGNLATPDERARIARAGACLVHCPGTHAFFGRERFDLDAWTASGVTVALGTDSLASNDALDLRREMALLRAAHPGLAPRTVLEMATSAGGRALGLAGRVGTLAAGAWADVAAHAVDGVQRADLDEVLASGVTEVRAVWLAGRLVGPQWHESLPRAVGNPAPRTHNNPPRTRG